MLQNEKLSAGNAFSDTSETIKPQNPVPTDALPLDPVWGLTAPLKPPSCFITGFVSKSAHYAHCFPSLCSVVNLLAWIYLMSTLMSVVKYIVLCLLLIQRLVIFSFK